MISIIRLPLFNFNGENNLPKETLPVIPSSTSLIPDTITRITVIKKIPKDNNEIELNSLKGEETMSDEFNDEFTEELDNDDISELDGAEELTAEELEQLESSEEDEGDLSKIIDDEELDDDEFPDIEEEDDFSGLDGE